MKQGKNNAGFSLVEVLVAIVILGFLTSPVFTSMVVSSRMNEKTTELLKAQLAVSSAVETLMAEGIAGASDVYDKETVDGVEVDNYPEVSVVTEEQKDDGDNPLPYYKVTVTSDSQPNVTVTTYIRAKAGGGA